MDAGADHRPARGNGAQGDRDQLSGGGEDDRRVERLGQPGLAGVGDLGAAIRVTRPGGAELEREALRLGVARPRQREHAPALVGGHLADDVGGGAETVEADPLRIAAEPQ